MISRFLVAGCLPGLLAAQQWVPMSSPPVAPPFRHHAPGVFDAARGRLVWFGGTLDATLTAQTVPLGDQWEYDGEGWARVFPRVLPPARYMHALCFDSLRQRVLLFGGQDRPYSNLDDTWQYQGGVWSLLSPAHRPPARRNLPMAYDSARDRVVLFGGVGAVYYGDTWEYDGADWAERQLVGPTAREGAGMAFDAARARMVLTGGSNPGGSGLTTTWEYDGVAWTSTPTAPYGNTAIVYDAVAQRVVSATAEWDGAAWSFIDPPTYPSTGRLLGFDSWRGERVAAAGASDPLLTARHDGVHWHSVARAAPRFLVQDTLRGRTLGIGYLAGGGRTGVWHWDGRRFAPLAVDLTASTWNDRFAPVYDPVRDVLYTFTPGPGGAYSWHELRCSDWQRIGGGVLPLGSVMAACHDVARARLVLVGHWSGSTAETWEYDGVSWTRRITPTLPFYFLGLNLGYDAVHQRVVLYGGFAPNDTWTYDGVDWTNVTVAHHPTPGNMFGNYLPLVFDSQRGVLLRTGGGETWQFDGTDWSQLPTATAPASVQAYDAVRDRHVAVTTTHVYEYAPGPRPTVATVGAGCTSSVATVALEADQPALLGRDSAVRLRGLPPEAGVGFVATGFQDLAWNGTQLPASLAPYGLAANCMLHIAPDLVAFVPHLGGTAVWHFTLPVDPALAGVRFLQQAAIVDPWLATPAPLAVSNAVAFVAGT